MRTTPDPNGWVARGSVEKSANAGVVHRVAPSSPHAPSRRSVLGLLTAAPVAAAALSACTGDLPDGEAPRPPDVPADLQPDGAFDRFVADRAGRGEFSGTLLLAHRGVPVLTRSHGMADRQRSVPNGTDTVFCLGSIVKSFAAVAVAQLAQRGELTFDGTIGDYLDGFPTEVADTVTIHHLLSHTSGIGRPPVVRRDGPPEPQRQPGTPEEHLEEELAVLRRLPLQFPPGTRNAYSNDAFLVLQAVVARVSGRSFYDHVREHVFSAAGMTRTDYLTAEQVLARDDIAHPYATRADGDTVDATAGPQFRSLGGAANGYSTAPDLLAFAVALYDGGLLEPAFASLATSGKVPTRVDGESATPPRSSFHAYGFTAGIIGEQRFVAKNGGNPIGVATQLDIFPDLDWVAVILTNEVPASEPRASGAFMGWLTAVVEQERELITRQGT